MLHCIFYKYILKNGLYIHCKQLITKWIHVHHIAYEDLDFKPFFIINVTIFQS